MTERFMNFLRSCWGPSSRRHDHSGTDALGRQDGLLWYKDIGRLANGDFSMAVVQANSLVEDQSQIESGSLSLHGLGPYGTFVGIYDGHGGPETSRGTLYVANVGDSRVVLGRLVKATGEVLAVQLSEEHNAGIESVRQELHALHPDDSEIVVLKHNVWRVKGVIQVSRSIGDVYLKKTEFNREPLQAKFLLREPFQRPILSSEPSISVLPLQLQDQFLIFASDGLWEHLSNQEAVDIVQNNPCSGIARRLVKAALQEAAKKREMRYSDLKKIDRGVRRHFHDDITVIVVFLNSGPTGWVISHKGPTVSIRGGIDRPASSLTSYASAKLGNSY
ncbi:phosphatase 2C [Musa troglodytarum]|uniref:protein-serine/threonine phosphatase n=1 Tax=Musa troglodytarum TaxID=320322 RepID=A0A9E7K6E6_9LILI|nr:phosphatase 2C [Musa troglodytarum]